MFYTFDWHAMLSLQMITKNDAYCLGYFTSHRPEWMVAVLQVRFGSKRCAAQISPYQEERLFSPIRHISLQRSANEGGHHVTHHVIQIVNFFRVPKITRLYYNQCFSVSSLGELVSLSCFLKIVWKTPAWLCISQQATLRLHAPSASGRGGKCILIRLRCPCQT